MPKRVTIADVAKAAGVSAATVSYVLNEAPNQTIPEPTRQRVHSAVAALGYTRSAAARALSTGRSDAVLLVLPPWPIGPLIAGVIENLTAELGAQGLSLVVRPELPDRTVAQLWRELAPIAVVYFGEVDHAERAAMREAGVYVASITGRGPGDADSGGDGVVVSNVEIGRLQAAHLIGAGHRRLGYALPGDPRVQDLAAQRLDGVTAACVAAGLDPPVTGGRPAWRAAGVTAVCAYNDEVAFALLHEMRAAGHTAPDDLAVVGADDIPTAPYALPPLTTVRQDVPEITARVADLVIHGVTGRSRPVRPPAQLLSVVVRQSG